jgi:hypothetical protein
MSDIALPALLQLLEQTTEPAIDYRAGGGAAEYSAQYATQQVTESATAAGRGLSSRQACADVAAGGSGRLGGWRVGAAHVLLRVDREQRQQRLGHR